MPGAAAGVCGAGVDPGASDELSVEMPGISWLNLALQLHHFRLARAVFQFEECYMGDFVAPLCQPFPTLRLD